eukprot:365772-Chlamydomonas_euryale.AAC.3
MHACTLSINAPGSGHAWSRPAHARMKTALARMHEQSGAHALPPVAYRPVALRIGRWTTTATTCATRTARAAPAAAAAAAAHAACPQAWAWSWRRRAPVAPPACETIRMTAWTLRAQLEPWARRGSSDGWTESRRQQPHGRARRRRQTRRRCRRHLDRQHGPAH